MVMLIRIFEYRSAGADADADTGMNNYFQESSRASNLRDSIGWSLAHTETPMLPNSKFATMLGGTIFT
jgi:hypothetical protein